MSGLGVGATAAAVFNFFESFLSSVVDNVVHLVAVGVGMEVGW